MKEIDMENYPRRAQFEHFCAMDNPFVTLTVKIDVTKAVEFCKKRKASFYMTMTHLVCRAANQVPSLRQRVRDGKIVEYDECGTSHIELLRDETYCYCTLKHNMDWDEFFPYAEQERQKATENPSIQDGEDADALFFITTLPWLRYEELTMPTDRRVSNPQFCWGKYEADAGGKIMLPMTIVAHHALVDGLHFVRFFNYLQKAINTL